MNKIDKIEGYSFQVDIINPDFGKNIDTNRVVDDIITTRDNINALMISMFNSRLLNLTQERYILDFFRPVKTEEEFTHRISSIGNLVGDLNLDFLRKVTGYNGTDKQSIDLFELFLAMHNVDKDIIDKVVKTFRKIRKVRQAYPIHTDTAKGLIDALSFFGIGYPISDYEKSWKTILEAYRDCLKIKFNAIKDIELT